MKNSILIAVMIMSCFYFGGNVLKAQEEEPKISEFIYVEKEPEILNLAEVRGSIGYPEEAVDASVEGTVVARVLVDKEGNYVKHKIVNEIHPALAKAVESKLSDLKFNAALNGGNPIMYWLNIPFPFKLLDETDLYEKQIEEYTNELGADPENYELWHKRGIARSQMGSLEDAIVDFTESLKLNPRKNKKKASKNTYEYLVYAHYSRGAIKGKQEKYQESIEDYTQSLAFAEEMKVRDSGVVATIPTIYLERGYMHALNKNYEAAKKDYRWVLENDTSKRCTVYELLADIGLAEKNYAELTEYYDGLVSCKPDDDLRYYSRGFYRFKAKDHEGAVADFTLVIEKTENLALKLASYNHMGLVYLDQGITDKAKETINKSLSINVLNPQAYYFRAKVLQAEGKTEEACKDLDRAINFGLEGDEVEEVEAMKKEICPSEE